MTDSPKPFHNPFAALAHLRGPQPAGDQATPPPAAKARPVDVPVKGPARAVVRLERAGRGGKEVTVVEHLALSASELDSWLKAMKAGLGCGGVVEGLNLVLQGDHRKRLPTWLAARGVKKVTLGS